MIFAKAKIVPKPRMNLYYLCFMAKAGSPKNTKNKAKHAKLMAQKKKKEREKKDAREARIKILKEKIKAQQKEE